MRALHFLVEAKPVTWGYFYSLCSVPLRSVEKCIFCALNSREFIVFSFLQAVMKWNQNVTDNDHNVTTWPLCAPLLSVRWDKGSIWWWFYNVVLYFCRSEDDSEDESLSHGGRQNPDNLYRVHMPSLYSCGSSYGSETSIPAAAHTVSNAPVTEYM